MKKASIITGMVMAGLIALGGTAISAEQANTAGSIHQCSAERGPGQGVKGGIGE
jgi:hypothetical protein